MGEARSEVPPSGRAFSSPTVRALKRETSPAARAFFSQGING
jgi:hypothetical protein